MDPLIILLLGMVVVIGGILWLKLNAFLALIAAALVVAMLTSTTDMYTRQLQKVGWQVDAVTDDARPIFVERATAAATGRYHRLRLQPDGTVAERGRFDLLLSDGRVETIRPLSSDPAASDSVETEQTRPVVGDWYVPTREFEAAVALRDSNWATRIADGFGTMCGKIGIVIALAAVIGRCLLDSGAAEQIVTAMRSGLGEKRTPLALVLSGFVIGIPVYFDTVFYLLLPLARALGQRSGRDYLLYILSIIVGATMAHSLVPPTPGPLLVASELGVGLGQMILAGGCVGLITATSGFLFAVWVNRKMTISIPTDDRAGDGLAENPTNVDEADTQLRVQSSPPLWLALSPIVIPVVLLSIGTFLKADALDRTSAFRNALLVMGDKHIALGLAAIVAILMLIRYRSVNGSWTQSLQDAVTGAGNIVLITAAGGAFGHVLRQSGIAQAIQQRFPVTEAGLGLLIVAFAITAVVRVAQGSATVAMITSVGIVAPLVQSVTLPFPAVFVALAIGCGSKPMPWMNDSGFWVITRMSGMSESESLRTFSMALTIMGLVGLAVTLAGAAVFSGG